MKINWTKPDSGDLSSYQRSYIDLVPEGELMRILENNASITAQLLSSLPPEKLKYRYAEGKWSIPQILVHMIDVERIFSYRILCIARGDKTPLPGFEENDYAKASNADERKFSDILEEYLNVRKATLCLLKSLDNSNLINKGIANNNPVSVLTICFMMAGHEMHHIHVIKEKYIK